MFRFAANFIIYLSYGILIKFGIDYFHNGEGVKYAPVFWGAAAYGCGNIILHQLAVGTSIKVLHSVKRTN